ncbi:golgin subfamily A member 4-like isoform X3 [Thunnus thynnus]|uniref:golgin subfamily A member 4-like isoform X3 n=1 Tax=Thunnus thynnus TaxID=8237 RepID=UPI003529476D
MRALLSGPLESSGVRGKQIFYKILERNEPHLIDDLKRTESETVMDVKVMDTVQVGSMMDKKLLIEILNDLSSEEFEKFKSLIELEKDFPLISRSRLDVADMQETVELMVEMNSRECVEVTKKVLKEMNRTDLVQRFSDISSRTKEKHLEHRPTLIQRVKTMTSVIELLLETLAGLSNRELEYFKQIIWSQSYLYKPYLEISWMLLMMADMQDTVFIMVQTFGQQSVKKTKDILIKMNRRDLVQRLSDSSSGPKKKYSVDEHLSALIHKVATKTAVRELLLETLNDLSDQELTKLKWLLQFTHFKKDLPWIQLESAHRTEVVDLMVEICGQQSVEVIREVFMEMKRTDLVQRLSETISGPKAAGSSVEVFGVKTTEGKKHSVDEQWPALIQRVETMTSVIELLLETLADLSDRELEVFKKLLQSRIHLRKPYLEMLMRADMQDTVFIMVQTFGQQSVKKTKDILIKMNRRDLVQRLSDSSSGPKKKHSVDEHLSALIHKVATKTAVRELLLETLNDLSDQELKTLKWLLQFTHFKKGLPFIPWIQLGPADRTKVVDLMVERCGQQSVEVIREVFKEMKRTDLVQRLSETSSVRKEKHSVDEQWPALIQKVETMTSVIELLLETLAGLSKRELEDSKEVLLNHLRLTKQRFDIQWRLLMTTDMQDIVLIIVQEYGQQSMEMMKKVLKDMNRPDLVIWWSLVSSEKHYVDNPIQKVATMAAVKEMLLETLKDLSFQELKKFKEVLRWTVSQMNLPDSSLRLSYTADREAIVNLMLQNYGQQSVDLMKKTFKKMSRSDLVQRLSDTSSGPKEKQRSSLPQKDVTMTPVKEKLLETLKELRFWEFLQFKEVLQELQMKEFPRIPRVRIEMAQNKVDLVELMVEICGQQSVEVTREVLKKMNKTDLVQRLSDTLSGSKGPSGSLEFGAHGGIMDETMTPVKKKLLETLEELRFRKIELFKWYLQTLQVKDLPRIPRVRIERADSMEDLVELIVEICGQQSVEVTREVLKRMNRMDLVQSLSDTSSGSKGPSGSLESGAHGGIMDETMTRVKEKLLETLEELCLGEIEQVKWWLQNLQMKDLPRIPGVRIERADSTVDLVDLMVEICGQQAVEVIGEVLMKMNRMDLVQILLDTSSGSKGPSRSLEFEAHGSIMESNDWTKLEPEVNSTDADEAPTYSLQSEAGKFECSVSDLRWVCEEKVSFKYQFWSWEEHMERMESLQYMPAGPLLDITVIAGKLNEVYLPHWICTDDSTILDKFAVLHIDACGDVVEDVSEVTSSHVKLSEPVFSPRAVLMKIGFPVKIKCNVLIYYKPNTTFLKLHVYLIPHDPALKQTVDKTEFSDGYTVIRKPRPDKYLKMQQGFVLTADIDTAKISPPKLTLRYDSQDPNFYEVLIKNPDRDFYLSLFDHYAKKGEPVCEPVSEPVWTCEIQEADYPKSGHSEAAASSAGPAGATVRALGSSSGATGRNTLTEGRSTEEQSVDELSALVQKAATVTTIKEKLLKMLQRLREEKFEDFKWFLQDRDLIPAELPCIPQSKLEKADRKHVVDLMEQTYSQQAAEVTKMLFKKIDRNDLVKLL